MTSSGEGSNGKGVLSSVVEAAMPNDSVCSIVPQNLGQDYSRALLAEKLLNVVVELRELELLDAASFKAIVAGDRLRDQVLRRADRTPNMTAKVSVTPPSDPQRVPIGNRIPPIPSDREEPLSLAPRVRDATRIQAPVANRALEQDRDRTETRCRRSTLSAENSCSRTGQYSRGSS